VEDKYIIERRRYDKTYQVTEIKMVARCRENGIQCNAEENDKKDIVYQKDRKTQEEMARRC
jgi:hypothetical protein